MADSFWPSSGHLTEVCRYKVPLSKFTATSFSLSPHSFSWTVLIEGQHIPCSHLGHWKESKWKCLVTNLTAPLVVNLGILPVTWCLKFQMGLQ